jgi:hypothetical protein
VKDEKEGCCFGDHGFVFESIYWVRKGVEKMSPGAGMLVIRDSFCLLVDWEKYL